MMDNLRLILLIAGVLLIVGIYAWDRLRRLRIARQYAREHAPGASRSQAHDHHILDDVLLADTGHLDDQPFDLGLDAVSGGGERALDDGALADFAVHDLDDDYPELDTGDLAVNLDEASASGLDDLAAELDAVADSKPVDDMPRLDDVDDAAVAATGGEADDSGAGEAGQIADKIDEGLIQILITARRGRRFSAEGLLTACQAAGLEHGAMRIFHHKVEGGGVFSMANLVEPGWFDPAGMDERFTSPGVCLFMPLAGGGDPVKTFDAMLMAAGTLAERLDAELRDDSRSMLSRQTATHMREQVTQYRARKQMQAQAAAKQQGGRRR